MRLKSNQLGLGARLRAGALGLAFLLVCTGGRAQTKNSNPSADAAAANSLYSQGLDALERKDLAGARAAFEKHYDRPAGVARIQDVLGVSAHGSAADKVTTSGGCKDADDSLRAAGVHAESEIAGNTVA